MGRLSPALFDPLRRQRDVDEGPHTFVARYLYYLPLDTPSDLVSLFFTAAVVEAVVKCTWYRTLARTRRIFLGRASPDASNAGSSPTNRFPQEVVDMIIAHFVYDNRSLLACSLTSRSWYRAAFPHLHRNLITRTDSPLNKKTKWPKPLRMASKHGLLPCITGVFISRGSLFGNGFSARELNYWTRREFSKLTNVRELSIEALGIPSFGPKIQQHFGQFSPTLRSLTLISPQGCGRQVVFFIGLFPHLEDLNLLHVCSACLWGSQEDGLTLVPPFVPPLRGRFITYSGDCFAKGMIDLFGEVQFRRMDLWGGGMQRLLYACPNTLEMLGFDVTSICGEDPPSEDMQAPANDFTGGSHQGLDLARNKSLRELEITAKSLISALRIRASGATSRVLKAVFSTIKSPAFSDVVVIYREDDFYNYAFSENKQSQLGDETTWYREQFAVFRAMHEVRDYRLVLSVNWGCDNSSRRSGRLKEKIVRELERAVKAEQAKGGLPSQIAIRYTEYKGGTFPVGNVHISPLRGSLTTYLKHFQWPWRI